MVGQSSLTIVKESLNRLKDCWHDKLDLLSGIIYGKAIPKRRYSDEARLSHLQDGLVFYMVLAVERSTPRREAFALENRDFYRVSG